jgi:hypothetical protein
VRSKRWLLSSTTRCRVCVATRHTPLAVSHASRPGWAYCRRRWSPGSPRWRRATTTRRSERKRAGLSRVGRSPRLLARWRSGSCDAALFTQLVDHGAPRPFERVSIGRMITPERRPQLLEQPFLDLSRGRLRQMGGPLRTKQLCRSPLRPRQQALEELRSCGCDAVSLPRRPGGLEAPLWPWPCRCSGRDRATRRGFGGKHALDDDERHDDPHCAMQRRRRACGAGSSNRPADQASLRDNPQDTAQVRIRVGRPARVVASDAPDRRQGATKSATSSITSGSRAVRR